MNISYIIIGFLLITNIIFLYLWKGKKNKKSNLVHYLTILKSVNELDWNRTNVFKEHIELLSKYYICNIDGNISPLIPLKYMRIKFPKEEMKKLFGEEGSNILYNMPLILVIFFIANLKTYRKDGKGLNNNPPLSPDKFLSKTIDFYKNLKDNYKQQKK